MSKVKSTIAYLTQKTTPALKNAAVCFPVNGQPLNCDGLPCINDLGQPLFPNVSKVVFCKDRYGSGAVYNKPCYAVEFEDSPQVILIDADDVSQISVLKYSQDDVEVPTLPED